MKYFQPQRRWSILKAQIVFADGRERRQSHVVWGAFPTDTRAKRACCRQQCDGSGLAQSSQPTPLVLHSRIEYVFRSAPRNWRTKLEHFFPPLAPLSLHQKWGLHIYVCLSLCRNSSSLVVTFSMPYASQKWSFFLFSLVPRPICLLFRVYFWWKKLPC